MLEFIPFRFKVSLFDLQQGVQGELLAQGAFSEVSGLEMTMATKTLKEGGRNWGDVQLAGKTTFAPIVLKRGITQVDDLYQWMDICTRQANFDFRMQGQIDVYDSYSDTTKESQKALLSWRIDRAMAVKFKSADLSATASSVALEEIHLVHEGLQLIRRGNANKGVGEREGKGNGNG